MSEYSYAIEVEAPVDEVFDFVSNPENMPRFLPTLKEAHVEEGDHVSIKGEAEGHSYKTEGEFHLDPDERTMHWSSEARHKYRGELHVTGDRVHSTVSCHLSFEPGEPMEQKMRQEKPDAEQEIQAALEKALNSVKSICEREATVRANGDRGYLV